MLKRRERLARARDISNTQRGKTRKDGYFVVKVLGRPRATNSRATVIVSKKVSSKAVDRNRVKRQVRAVLEVLLGKLPEPVDVIVSVRKSALGGTTQDFKDSLKKLLV